MSAPTEYFAVRFRTPQGDEHRELVRLHPTGWGSDPHLLARVAVPGYALVCAYEANGFNNPVHAADLAGHDGRREFGEYTGDVSEPRIAEEGEPSPGESYRPITYRTLLSRTPLKIWTPPAGYPIPKRDGGRIMRWQPLTFVPFTTVPFGGRNAVEQVHADLGLPTDEISAYDPVAKRGTRFVGRVCNPGWGGLGRLHFSASMPPSFSGGGRVASRPRYDPVFDGEHPTIVGEVVVDVHGPIVTGHRGYEEHAR